MRIEEIDVEAIRSIDRFQATGLGDVIVLAGPNGSGKSSLLDAIRAFKAACATAVHQFEVRPGQQGSNSARVLVRCV